MKKLLLLSAVVLAGVGGMHLWRSAAAARPEFRTLAITRDDLVLPVSATGSVEPVETVDVGAQIPGKIMSFGPDPSRRGKLIDYCSRVKQGDALALLDDAPHQADLKKAEANLWLAESDVARCDAQLKLAESAYRRAERLRGTNSESEFENAQANRDIAKAERKVAEARLEQAKIAKEQAEINLGYTRILSPVDGVVIDRRVNVGQTVIAGLNAPTLFLLAKDLRRMYVLAAVNEADIGDIHIGQSVTFTVDAYRDRVFSGTVSQIRLNANMAQNVVTYGVVVDVDNRDEKLLPSMTAKLKFEVDRRTNVLCVPNQALRWQPTLAQITPSERERLKANVLENAGDEADESLGEIVQKVDLGPSTVWIVAQDGFVRPVAVETGLSDGIVTEIADGRLEAGMEVVVHAVREAQPDFVQSFIKQVVRK